MQSIFESCWAEKGTSWVFYEVTQGGVANRESLVNSKMATWFSGGREPKSWMIKVFRYKWSVLHDDCIYLIIRDLSCRYGCFKNVKMMSRLKPKRLNGTERPETGCPLQGWIIKTILRKEPLLYVGHIQIKIFELYQKKTGGFSQQEHYQNMPATIISYKTMFW